jgi:hypothetical protein
MGLENEFKQTPFLSYLIFFSGSAVLGLVKFLVGVHTFGRMQISGRLLSFQLGKLVWARSYVGVAAGVYYL